MRNNGYDFRKNIVAEILDNHLHILFLLNDMIGWRAGYNEHKTFTERVLSEDLSAEVYVKSFGLKIESGFITGKGLLLGKLVGSYVYANRIDFILGEVYYEKMTAEKFIGQLDKQIANLRFETVI